MPGPHDILAWALARVPHPGREYDGLGAVILAASIIILPPLTLLALAISCGGGAL